MVPVTRDISEGKKRFAPLAGDEEYRVSKFGVDGALNRGTSEERTGAQCVGLARCSPVKDRCDWGMDANTQSGEGEIFAGIEIPASHDFDRFLRSLNERVP